jgi:hypothetical protein
MMLIPAAKPTRPEIAIAPALKSDPMISGTSVMADFWFVENLNARYMESAFSRLQ